MHIAVNEYRRNRERFDINAKMKYKCLAGSGRAKMAQAAKSEGVNLHLFRIPWPSQWRRQDLFGGGAGYALII